MPTSHLPPIYGKNEKNKKEGTDVETVRVSGQSRPNAVAGAIAALLRLNGEVEVQAIGPSAVNQAVKAIAIARGYIHPDGLDLYCTPSFVKLELANEERTAMKFVVYSHKTDTVAAEPPAPQT